MKFKQQIQQQHSNSTHLMVFRHCRHAIKRHISVETKWAKNSEKSMSAIEKLWVRRTVNGVFVNILAVLYACTTMKVCIRRKFTIRKQRTHTDKKTKNKPIIEWLFACDFVISGLMLTEWNFVLKKMKFRCYWVTTTSFSRHQQIDTEYNLNGLRFYATKKFLFSLGIHFMCYTCTENGNNLIATTRHNSNNNTEFS